MFIDKGCDIQTFPLPRPCPFPGPMAPGCFNTLSAPSFRLGNKKNKSSHDINDQNGVLMNKINL